MLPVQHIILCQLLSNFKHLDRGGLLYSLCFTTCSVWRLTVRSGKHLCLQDYVNGLPRYLHTTKLMLLLKLNRDSFSQLPPQTMEQHGKCWIKIFKEPVARSDQFPATGREKTHSLAFSKQSVLGCKSKYNVAYVLSSPVLNQDRQLWTQGNNLLFVYYTVSSNWDSTETKSLPGGLCFTHNSLP